MESPFGLVVFSVFLVRFLWGAQADCRTPRRRRRRYPETARLTAIKAPLSPPKWGKPAGGIITGASMKPTLLLGLALSLCGSFPASAQDVSASPAVMISHYRAQHGETGVSLDAKLNRVAQAQADAMAAKDVLSHDVLGLFGFRVV